MAHTERCVGRSIHSSRSLLFLPVPFDHPDTFQPGTLIESQPTPTLLFSSLLIVNYMCYILWFVCHWFFWHHFPHKVCTLHIMLSFFVGIFNYVTLWMVRMCCMHRLTDFWKYLLKIHTVYHYKCYKNSRISMACTSLPHSLQCIACT